MDDPIRKLSGANMDIDLATPADQILWTWNAAKGTTIRKCAVKNVSICRYFCGVEFLDTLLCCYPYQNLLVNAEKTI